MPIWHQRSKSKAFVSHPTRERNSRRRGLLSQALLLLFPLCSRVPKPKVTFLMVLIAIFFLVLDWSLHLSDPFPYSISDSSFSSFFEGTEHDGSDSSSMLTSHTYSKEREVQNERACESTVWHLQNGGRVLLYNFTSASNGPGMASLTFNLLQIALFMDERWNRTHLAIDERLLKNYRWDANHGLFGGYLHLQERACVLSTPNKALTTSATAASSPEVVFSGARVCNFWDVKCPVLEIDANPQGFMFEKARRVTKRYFMQRKTVEEEANEEDPESKRKILLTRFFNDLSRFSCLKLPGGLRLHPHVHRLVQRRQMFLAPNKDASNISKPAAWTVDTATTIARPMDLAFHIRRGDKVAGGRKESRAFNAQEYWDRFVNRSSQLPSQQQQQQQRRQQQTTTSKYQFQHCFVATDDYEVVSELQAVLQRPQPALRVQVATKATEGTIIVPCQHLWTLTPPNYTSTWQDRDEILGFLAQMRVLIHAKYFVGSFSSNVGGLVALLRGCHYHNNGKSPRLSEYNEANRYRHFFDSYAVDWDEWGFL